MAHSSQQLAFTMTNETKKWWTKSRLDPVLNLIGEGPSVTLSVPSFRPNDVKEQKENDSSENAWSTLVESQQPRSAAPRVPAAEIPAGLPVPLDGVSNEDDGDAYDAAPANLAPRTRLPSKRRRRRRRAPPKVRKVLYKGVWLEIPMGNAPTHSSSGSNRNTASRRRRHASRNSKEEMQGRTKESSCIGTDKH